MSTEDISNVGNNVAMVQTKPKVGYSASAFLGYETLIIRTEAQLSYISTDIDSAKMFVPDSNGVLNESSKFLKGYSQSFTGMVNLILDVPFLPFYTGAGLGYTRHNSRIEFLSMEVETVKYSDFSAQGILGLGFNLFKFGVYADYRPHVTRPQFKSGKYLVHHMLNLGIILRL